MPRVHADSFESTGTHLHRYASRLNAVEINSSFYRVHRADTYRRWARTVPDGFRFAVKAPKTITHELRLRDCEEPLRRFAGAVAGLGDKRGPVLVQLPPSLEFDHGVAEAFFATASKTLGGAIVCEPRHPSWFSQAAGELLAEARAARVAADPARTPEGALPGGWRGLRYFRLHGSPKIYWSRYSEAFLEKHAEAVLSTAGSEVWTFFDNTAAGFAPVDALRLARLLDPR